MLLERLNISRRKVENLISQVENTGIMPEEGVGILRAYRNKHRRIMSPGTVAFLNGKIRSLVHSRDWQKEI